MIAVLIARLGAGRLARAALRCVLLLLLSALRSGERLGRLLERLDASERSYDVQREMMEAAARRPRDLDDFAVWMRDGRF